MTLGCTAGYDIKPQGNNDKKLSFLSSHLQYLSQLFQTQPSGQLSKASWKIQHALIAKQSKPPTSFKSHSTPLKWFRSSFQGNIMVLLRAGDIYNRDDSLRTAMKVQRKTGSVRKVIYNKTISSQARLCDSAVSISYFSLTF